MKDFKKIRVNEAIRAPEVRVIGEDGKQIGIMRVSDALKIAYERGLDLVEVSPEANPPVCKIIDFGKYKYQLEKKEKEARKKVKEVEVKEFKMRYSIGDHDYSYRKDHMIEILKEGNQVKVTIVFKGREIAFKDKAYELIERIKSDLADYGRLDKEPKFEGRKLVSVFVPIKKK